MSKNKNESFNWLAWPSSLLRNDQWSWIDGSPIVGNGHWLSDQGYEQPDNAHGGTEFCGMMNYRTNGTWNDEKCDCLNIKAGWMQGYVCQI